jgi:Family of unknown function (DUF6527)
MKRATMAHEFVDLMPAELKEGVLYVSIPYATAVHLCACGCGVKVVTPISPPGWKVVWDGDTVSLDPSIGNWQFPCRSHYWIRRGKVVWAPAMSDQAIAAGRQHDAREREAYFAMPSEDDSTKLSAPPDQQGRTSLIHRLRRLLRLGSARC